MLFDNLRTPGVCGEDCYRAGQRKRIIFAKGQVSKAVPGDSLSVKFKDLILGDETEMADDLGVLDVGMMPDPDPDPHARLADEESAKAKRMLPRHEW